MQHVNLSANYPSLSGHVVIVTGGASGVGRAIVKACAAQQACVAFLDVQDAAAELLIEGIVESHGELRLLSYLSRNAESHFKLATSQQVALYCPIARARKV
jgi:D-xylose 1-dehydrogenase